MNEFVPNGSVWITPMQDHNHTADYRAISRRRTEGSQRLLPVLLLVAATALSGPSAAHAICPDNTETFARWEAVYDAPDVHEPNTLALELAACLASPNPILRDRYAYELLTYWMRRELIGIETIEQLRGKLQPWLGHGLGESTGKSAYGRAFAALVLSEIVRYDTQHSVFDADVLGSLLNDGMAMLQAEQDFRGLDGVTGWIHAIAHSSDLLWRFARHPAINTDQQRRILDAVAIKVAPAGNHPYVTNEFDRLARVVGAIMQRQELSPVQLTEWVNQFADPRHLSKWSDAFASPSGMAELHNTKNFLRALLALARAAHDSQFVASIDAALAGMP